MNQPILWGAGILPVAFILLLAALVPFRRYTGMKMSTAALALLGSIVVGVFQAFHRARVIEPFLRPSYDRQNNNFEQILSVAAAGLAFPLLVALVLRLWGRWIGDSMTAEERLPGAVGLRAWFSASNVTVGILLIVCAWWGHDISPMLSGVLVGGVLAAQPLLGLGAGATDSTPASANGPGLASVPRPPAEDLSVEREKIVSMLEAGKLTPEESAELLQALGESSRRSAPAPLPLTSHQRLMLIGAAIVALGFFLPWFTFNPGKEATRLMGRMQSNIPASFGGDREAMNILSMGLPQWSTDTMSISGGDIRRGLGWATLALALAAALLPYVATTLDDRTARTIRLLCLGLGAFIVLYLLTQNIRFVGIGLIIALAGYALEIAGALRERRTATA